MNSKSAVTELLSNWRSGDTDALDSLTPLVYDELRRIAGRYMQSERAEHTLQATALVNEVFVRLADAEVTWQDRAHFFAVAARQMRRILIDHARARNSSKRGSGQAPLPFTDSLNADDVNPSTDILALDDALNKLAALDARKSDIIVLHFFGGLTQEETAEALDISASSVQRELRLAKTWLLHELKDG